MERNQEQTCYYEGLKVIDDVYFCAAVGIPEEALNLLLELLMYHPKERLTAAKALKHPFLTPRSHTLKKRYGRNVDSMKSLLEFVQSLAVVQEESENSPKGNNELELVKTEDSSNCADSSDDEDESIVNSKEHPNFGRRVGLSRNSFTVNSYKGFGFLFKKEEEN